VGIGVRMGPFRVSTSGRGVSYGVRMDPVTLSGRSRSRSRRSYPRYHARPVQARARARTRGDDGRRTLLIWLMAPLLPMWWVVISEIAALVRLGLVVARLLQQRSGAGAFVWPRLPIGRAWYLPGKRAQVALLWCSAAAR
jgi:hypothetical protein